MRAVKAPRSGCRRAGRSCRMGFSPSAANPQGRSVPFLPIGNGYCAGLSGSRSRPSGDRFTSKEWNGEALFGAGTVCGICPEGARQSSPGQRPGNAELGRVSSPERAQQSPSRQDLLRPFRAGALNLAYVPRALPWADLSQPLRLKKCPLSLRESGILLPTTLFRGAKGNSVLSLH
jgi:hypothetical protein